MSLRPYQAEATKAVLREFGRKDKEIRGTLLVAATGTGKTVMFAALAGHVAKHGGRTLVLAHREELVDQAADKIARFAGLTVGVEMAERTADTLFSPQVVVASVQTMGRRLAKFAPDEFLLVVVDEAHHAVAASYRTILDHFATAKVLGVTATPDRLDGTALGQVFDSVAFSYDILDAIKDGWLVPVKQRFVEVSSLDLSQVKLGKDGDFKDSELEAQLLSERTLHEIAAPTVELVGERPTVVFTAGVAQAHALAGVLGRYVGADRAVALDGETDSAIRRGAIRDFEARRVQFLVNCGLFTEGFDAPLTAAVAVARPTKSRALYTQMVGRGTRPDDGKEDLLVLDYTGKSFDHSLVCVADILDGSTDEAVAARVREIASEVPEMPVHEALALAADQVARRHREEVVAKARYHAVDIDPFDVLAASKRSGRWGGVPATEAQLDLLSRFGVPVARLQGLEKGQASELIGRCLERRNLGLCTYKQAAILAKHGLNPDLEFKTASEALTALSAQGWRADELLRARFGRHAA